MREIKFRGRSVENGGWVYGLYREFRVIEGFEKYSYQNSGKNYFIDDKYSSESFKIIPETVSQYTGIDDCNGNEIYEGDIAQWKEYDLRSGTGRTYRGRVEFHNGSFRIGSFLLYNSVGKRGFKIIGNIYENPELMEVEQ